MEILFFGFFGLAIAVCIVNAFRQSGHNSSRRRDSGGAGWFVWGASDSSHSHGSHDHDHSHHAGCGHDGGGDSGGGGDGGGGGD